MSTLNIREIIKDILIKEFNISEKNFDWNTPLQELNKEFNILGILLDFQHSLQSVFATTIDFLDLIEPAIHTPEDIVNIIEKNA